MKMKIGPYDNDGSMIMMKPAGVSGPSNKITFNEGEDDEFTS